MCASGYRSSVAAGYLRREGHDDVVNLLGVISAWFAEGLPVETDSP
ncbi:MAG: rhodanese-like domain-containing protein [Actinomycetota bacterium]|nr:rhodanese-like domain-containing protein [Actinomycetota bacterium]